MNFQIRLFCNKLPYWLLAASRALCCYFSIFIKFLYNWYPWKKGAIHINLHGEVNALCRSISSETTKKLLKQYHIIFHNLKKNRSLWQYLISSGDIFADILLSALCNKQNNFNKYLKIQLAVYISRKPWRKSGDKLSKSFDLSNSIPASPFQRYHWNLQNAIFIMVVLEDRLSPRNQLFRQTSKHLLEKRP